MVQQLLFYSLCEMCPNTEFFWSVFPRIRTEYGPEKTLYLDAFHAVITLLKFFSSFNKKLNLIVQEFIFS